MTQQYQDFIRSVIAGSNNALGIFVIALGCVIGYRSLDRFAEQWRPFAKLIAWVYAVIVLIAVIYLSMEV